MGGPIHAHGRRRWALLAVLALTVMGALVVAAPPALAVECDGLFMHGSIDPFLMTTCESCHEGTRDPTTGVFTPDLTDPIPNTVCTETCHLGGFEARPVDSGYGTCWSCHDPGEDMAAYQTSEGCGATVDGCHVVDAATNQPHYGSSTEGCLVECHTTALQSRPNGSPHHDDGFATCYDCHNGDIGPEVHEQFMPPIRGAQLLLVPPGVRGRAP